MRLGSDWRAVRRLVLVCLLGLASADAVAQSGFDRPGGDYRNFVVRSGDPLACAQQCDNDARCRAWSFAYPRTKNRGAVCWLKFRVTARTADPCCTSGVRGAGLIDPLPGLIEFSIDRWGADYRSFDTVLHADGAHCAAACRGDPNCRAWTYARPGYGTATPRCYLKGRVTTPQRRPCCISGVVR